MNKIKNASLILALSVTVQLQAQEQEPVNQVAAPMITESSVPDEDIYIDDIVRKRMIKENLVLPYESIREADVAWEKRFWRVIETREKLNLHFMAEEQPFFNILKELLENGDITAFEDEKFKEALTYEQVEDKLFKVDTITTFDYDTYEEKIQIVKNTKDWRAISKFRIKEIWFFDEEASMMKNRILGIAPIFKEEVEGLETALEYPLFWVYYPEARNYLAKYRLKNDHNDMAPMSWADCFDTRFFNSYIYKRSNVLDYRVEDLFDPNAETTGIDRLMESDRIKAELFNFEHDLWEY